MGHHRLLAGVFLLLCTTKLSAQTCDGNWQCLGPTSLPVQNMGKVDAVWADNTNPDYILAGTVGGLFKTTDGGGHWQCITDNAPIAGGFTPH